MDNNNAALGFFGSFLLGFLMGGLIGGIVALLFAPQSGEETREMIKDKSIEIRDQAQERAGAAAEQLRAKADELGKNIRERTGTTVVVEEAPGSTTVVK
jgi:gas vesicle protein